MKKLMTFLIALVFSSITWGQTVLISPTGDGGFETGLTPAANNWTAVNSTTDGWYVGAVPVVSAGVNCGYVSSTAGVDWTYSQFTVIQHLYYDVTLPSGESKISLTFKWKAMGEGTTTSDWDNMKVFFGLSSAIGVPVANTAVSGTYQISGAGAISGMYKLNSTAWNSETITLTGTPGATYRLVFSWKSDGSDIANPPAAIDEVSLTSMAPDALHGIYTIDNSMLTTTPMVHDGTGNFASFTAAINHLNSEGISGAVTFLVTDGQMFTEDCPAITATGTAINTITFRKSGTGTNPVIKPTGTTGTSDAGIIISGGDYITFDGIDITIATGSAVEYGYAIRNATATNGAKYNSVKNSKIILNRTNTSSKGIYQYRSVTASDTNGTNSHNVYQSNTIENSYMGIYLYGASSYPDLGCYATYNTVGAATANDIGAGSSTTNGIRASYQSGIMIGANTVRNVSTTGATLYGIYLEGGQGTNYIFNNKVFSIGTTSTSTSYVVYGIRTDINSTYTVNVFNNMVSDLNHGITTASSTQVIRAMAVGISGTGTGNFMYNTVKISENAFPTSTAMYIGGGTVYTADNVFVNASTAGATSKRYCIYRSSGTLLSDYNDLYIDVAGTNNFTGYYTADQITLANWQTASGSQDMHSIAVNPTFTSLTDLHTTTSALNGIGTPIAGITFDIDMDPRDINTPDLGADEFTPSTLDMSAQALVAPLTTGCYGAAETVTVTVKNNGISLIDFSVNPTTVTVNVTGAVTQTLNATINSGTLAAGGTQNVNMSTTLNMTTAGTYTFNASTTVTGDGNPANDAMAPATRTVLAPTALPYTQNFDAGTAPPTGWTTTGWNIGTTHANPSTGNGIYKNMWSSATTAQFTLPKLGPVVASDNLSFDYRIVNYTSYPATATPNSPSWGSIVIKISTDCGVTFSTFATIDPTNHVESLSWANKSYSLASFAGSSIIVQVNTNWSAGDYYVDFDNFNIQPPPACVPPTVQTVSTLTSVGATLGWTSPDSFFDIFLQTTATPVPDGSTTPTIDNHTGNSLTWSGGSPNTTYYWWVRTDCAADGGTGQSTWSGPMSFYTGYCVPAPTSVDGEGITNVTFSTVNNTTVAEPTNYGDYSAMVGNVTQGATVPVSITYQTGFTYDTKIWIDWNDDLDFADAGEEVYSGTSTYANPTTLAASFIVPVAAPLGNHRMRIGGQDNGPVLPCYTGSYGAFEDYTVNVQAPVLPTITSLGATSGCVGTSLIINGTDLADATLVTIGGTSATITATTSTSVTVTVGTGTTGTVSVTTIGGTATSTETFTIIQLPSVFTVSGGGAYCPGGTGVSIALDGSVSGVNYDLSTSPVTTLAGTGSALTFGPSAFEAGVYTVTATDPITTCSIIMTGNANVTVNPLPTAVTVTPASETICSGDVQVLVASGGTMGGTGTIGAGTATNTSTTPYKGYYGGNKSQFIYTAGELTAMGMEAGLAINSIAFSITSFTGPYTFADFTIGMKNTSSANLTAGFETGVTTVLTPETFVLTGAAPFTVTHALTTPFIWDGTSNLLVETCFCNHDGGGASENSANVVSTSLGNMARYYSHDSETTVCTAPGAGSVNSTRPNITLGYGLATQITWSPVNDLYTDALATIPYTGTPATTVYAKPTANVSYTATSTAANSCTSSGTSAITVNSLPVANVTVSDNLVCYREPITISVALTGTGPWLLHGLTKTEIGGATDVLPDTLVTTSPYLIVDQPQLSAYYHIESFTDISTGCTNDSANWITVTVNPLPTAFLSASNNNVCSGDVVNFSIALSGTGPWLLHGLTSTKFDNISQVMPDVLVTSSPYTVSQPVASSAYYHVESVTDQGTGCTTDTANWLTVIVNQLPEVTDVTLLSSTDQASWDAVNGDFTNGYSMCINPATPYYYLDINTLTGPVNPLTGTFTQNAFTLDVASVPSGFYAYWAAKGVVSGASGWQGVMWNIISGTAPMFYINYTGTDYQLIDGLQYQVGGVAQTLRITGDYPQGNYKFTGSVTDVNGCMSSFFDVYLEMNSSPVVSDVTLLSSTDQANWTAVNGDFVNGYSMCINPATPYYYLDINTLTGPVNPLTGTFAQNAFFLDVVSVPSGFYAYWAAKGVVSGASGWQGVMWNIISGTAPMFYINYTGTDYQLIDGLQYQVGGVAQTLRITGDYPQGNYKFTGSVTDVNGCVSSFFDVFLEMNTMPAPPTIGNITQPTCALATGSIALTGLPSGNWTINPGNITGTGASYTVSGLAAGTYNYTVNNGQCTSVASTDVVINTQPVTPAAPVVGTITQPTCVLATGSVVLNGLPSGNWTINPGGITGSGISTTLSGLATGTYNFTVNNGQCTSVATPDVVINTQPVTPAAPMVGTITQPTCILATGSVVLNGLPSGNWTINPGNITGTGASYTVSGLAAGTYNYTVNNGQCTSVASTDVVINTQPVTPAAPVVGTITQPTCAVQSGSVVLDGLPSGNWTINPGNVSGSTVSTTISGLAPGTYNFDVTNASGCTSAASANVDISANLITTAEAGPTVIYYGTPVQIGVVNNGSGTIIWSPATGLNDPGIAQPLASPATTTTYTITVDNNGCVRTDTVTVVYGGIGHMIAGKTRYLKMATAGNPAPNPPTYSPAIYNIDNVEVILKSSPGGAVIATTVSNANGEYQFTGVPDGDYILAYDHIPYPDTMQYVNHTNAVDLALLKYYVGHNPLTDPSRNFSEKHRKAANVDNNASINTVDVARISGKIGMPNDPAKNFPKGNWVAFDTLITMAGSDLNITLQTVAYGDYNASSVKYQGAATNWGMVKELPDENIIVRSDESIMMSDPDYFEVPLRISTKMNELSAVGLELSYPSDKYKLVSASMSNTGKKGDAIKINPTLEEIIAANNDLLVTDIDGVIRVVFATTDHFDIAANEELVKLGFRSLIDPGRGELDFNLNGTGLIANQYGEINADAYLTMPKIFVQGDDMEAGFELAGYPNPFSGDATLTYSIPENGTVKLSVYNAIGELVALLVNESQISGKHSAVFSPVNLPAGMYTFKLEFTGSDKSKLMVLKMVH